MFFLRLHFTFNKFPFPSLLTAAVAFVFQPFQECPNLFGVGKQKVFRNFPLVDVIQSTILRKMLSEMEVVAPHKTLNSYCGGQDGMRRIMPLRLL